MQIVACTVQQTITAGRLFIVSAGCSEHVRKSAHVKTLPGEAAPQQEDEGVRQGLHVVSPAGRAPQVGVRARVPHCAPAGKTHFSRVDCCRNLFSI